MSRSNNSVTSSRFGTTRAFFRKQLWIWPILAAVVLAIVGFAIRSVVESEVKKNLAAQLETILDADVTALKIWLKSQERSAATIAADAQVRELIESLGALANQPEFTARDLLQARAQQDLRNELQAWLTANEYEGFVALTQHALFLAADRDELVGRDDLPIPEGLFEQVFAGKATVTRPFGSKLILKSETGEAKAGVPTMYAVAPVRNAQGEVIAGLGFRIRPEKEFTRILSVARAGESGETYAFDQEGWL
ncbi:MAG: cache domain-containing protein, partial [Planctomycetes bacterium]|nr:cache domain-containing protein [Planctomycetota bacterium]